MFNFTFNVRCFCNVLSVFNEDIKSSCTISFLCKLDFIIVFIIGTVGEQDFNNLDKKLSYAINKFMRSFKMFFQLYPAIFNNLVIENQFAFDWVVCHEILASLQILNIVILPIGQSFSVQMRNNISDCIVLLQNG